MNKPFFKKKTKQNKTYKKIERNTNWQVMNAERNRRSFSFFVHFDNVSIDANVGPSKVQESCSDCQTDAVERRATVVEQVCVASH